jgi:DNA invertase Pin-like site-specific DNA recombinase
MNLTKKITTIPATRGFNCPLSTVHCQLRKVAAYARVSTDEDEQLNSLEAQKNHYTEYIRANADWEFAGVYADEGLSGTSTKKRGAFNRMISDALGGKIDVILTKSLSRFARNTLDTLSTVRKLKERGIAVYFEKENIDTLDAKGELLLTIMSSLAQEESRSISENVKRGVRWQMENGRFSLPYKQFLGYERGPDGLPQIVESEAETVREIYRLFFYGKSPSTVAKTLTARKIPTPAGKEAWRASTVESILRNEKYKGDAILQKGYTPDFLTKKRKINRGEIPKIHIENSHPAIIAPDFFDLVQQEFINRKTNKTGFPRNEVSGEEEERQSARTSDQREDGAKRGTRRRCGEKLFSGKIVCGVCGAFYGPKIQHSADKYRREVWACNGRHYGGAVCAASALTGVEIKTAFIAAFNKVLADKAEILQAYGEIRDALTDTAILERERADAEGELEIVRGLLEKCVAENARAALDQRDYAARCNALAARYEAAQNKLRALEAERLERTAKRAKIDGFLQILEARDGLLSGFDEELFYTSVERITVHSDKRLTFHFRNGSVAEIPVK